MFLNMCAISPLSQEVVALENRAIGTVTYTYELSQGSDYVQKYNVLRQ